MSDTSKQGVWRSRAKKLSTALDWVGHCLIWAFVVAVLPMTAVSLFTRTV